MVMRAPSSAHAGAGVSRPACRMCGASRTSLGVSRPSIKDVSMNRRSWRVGAARPDDLEPSFNPFEKKDKKKEDAAKKALEEMFSGKKDVLADFDGGGDDGGDGGPGGEGGGGGGGWSWDEFKGNFGNLGPNLMKWFKSLGKTIGAVLLFFGIFVGMTCIGPISRGAVTFVRLLLRLDKPSEVFADTSAPAGTQRSALFDDDDDDDSESKENPTGGIAPS
ncbi:hypothetical protein BSKO_09472 [Bryopsis sp. KO-2023]|nr:hypothetical protein BSKO_09472 [Bryopsis sp. KO-2023]